MAGASSVRLQQMLCFPRCSGLVPPPLTRGQVPRLRRTERVHRGNFSWWRRSRGRMPSPTRHLLLVFSLSRWPPAGTGELCVQDKGKRDGVLTRECEDLARAARPGRKHPEPSPRSGYICLCFAVSLLWTWETQAPGRTWLRRAAGRPKPTWATWGRSRRWAAGAPAKAFGVKPGRGGGGAGDGERLGLSFFSTT